MKKFIPYSRQFLDKKDIEGVIRVLRSDWLTQGPKVEEFERALARYVRSRYAVSFSSGTAAMHAAYFAAGVKKGDEVITTPLTFAATANVAIWQGAKVVFADIDEETGNLDPVEVEKKITKRTKVIVPVDYAGLPARLDEFRKIVRKHRLILIEDAAHALGASYKGIKVGSIADMTMFSFHPVKSITTGEGGAVATNSKNFYDRLLMFRNHGITKDRRKFIRKGPGDWYYEMQELGLNYRLTDIQAALGISQLKKISKFVAARRRIARAYDQALSGIYGITLPSEPRGFLSSYHLYPIRLSGKFKRKRDKIFAKLRSAGIGVQVHYIPVYWHPYYKKLGYKKGLCPKAEVFYKSAISLPIFPGLSVREHNFVMSTLKKFL